MKVKIINSTIQGYHVYKVRPYQEIPMDVKVEDNQFDNNAMGVWMPPLSEIPVSYYEVVTRPAN